MMTIAGLPRPAGAGASWSPGRFPCDTVAAPVDVCCGIFDQLSRLGGPAPPIAHVGDVLLFLVRPGSAATALGSSSACSPADCEALGIEIRDHAGQPEATGAALTNGSWVMPPSDDLSQLPPASAVVAAIRAAYAATQSQGRYAMANPPNTISDIGTAFGGDDLSLIRQLLGQDGYAYVTGIPDGFDYLAVLRRLGEPVPQYHGALIRDVRPEPDIGNDVYSASNTRELTPHTESYEFDGLPPRFVALWCVQPAEGPGGETTLADGYRLLRQFSPHDQQAMHSRVYEWRSSPSLASRGVTMVARHPILESHRAGLVMRYSNQDIVRVDDGLQPRYVDGGRQFFEANKLAIRIDRNALLVWDNWRMMHARNGFTDRSRHLRRVLISAA